MLSVVCFKWKPAAGYRSTFGPETVNVLRRMVRRNYAKRHRFICITDDATGIDPEVEIVPLWRDFEDLKNPGGSKNPSCYRRLKLFSREAEKIVGKRFVTLDLDAVIIRDVAPLWDRPEDIVLWGDTARGTPYNGSMILHRTGSRSHVWETFDPIKTPQAGVFRRYIGSDQASLAVLLGPNEPKWTSADGVLSFRNEVAPTWSLKKALPDNARIVFFHGRHDPWNPDIQATYPFVRDNWR